VEVVAGRMAEAEARARVAAARGEAVVIGAVGAQREAAGLHTEVVARPEVDRVEAVRREGEVVAEGTRTKCGCLFSIVCASTN
jgi:hypothetical protein